MDVSGRVYTAGTPVPNRPVITAPAFGKWLAAKRGGRSHEAVAVKVRPLVEGTGLKVNRSLILKLEAGRVPSWPLLAALSRVYQVPLEETLQELTQSITFPGATELLRAYPVASVKPPQQPVAAEPYGRRPPVSDASTDAPIIENRVLRVLESLEARVRLLDNTLTDAVQRLEYLKDLNDAVQDGFNRRTAAVLTSEADVQAAANRITDASRPSVPRKSRRPHPRKNKRAG